MKNGGNSRKLDYTLGGGQAVTGLYLSYGREAGPLTHNIIFHKNLF
jgi:hypothetical protein